MRKEAVMAYFNFRAATYYEAIRNHVRTVDHAEIQTQKIMFCIRVLPGYLTSGYRIF